MLAYLKRLWNLDKFTVSTLIIGIFIPGFLIFWSKLFFISWVVLLSCLIISEKKGEKLDIFPTFKRRDNKYKSVSPPYNSKNPTIDNPAIRGKSTTPTGIDKPVSKTLITFIGDYLSDNDRRDTTLESIHELEESLKKKIKGQDEVIYAVIQALKRAFSGVTLNDKKPISTFLFLGPTGTGKTEIVKQTASALKRPLVRFDMPNFNTDAAIWTLIGSPVGYAGSQKSGQLTGQIQANPNAVLLLDEIEKAHPKLWDPFLRVFDEGAMKDQSHGFTVSFKNVIIFLTSNLLAFEEWTDDEKYLRNLLLNEGYFRPELINRIDRIIMFRQLSQSVLKEITANIISDYLNSFLAKNKLTIEARVDKKVVEYITSNIDTKFGARDVERFIIKEIGDRLVDEYFKLTSQDSIQSIDILLIENKIGIKIR